MIDANEAVSGSATRDVHFNSISVNRLPAALRSYRLYSALFSNLSLSAITSAPLPTSSTAHFEVWLGITSSCISGSRRCTNCFVSSYEFAKHTLTSYSSLMPHSLHRAVSVSALASVLVLRLYCVVGNDPTTFCCGSTDNKPRAMMVHKRPSAFSSTR